MSIDRPRADSRRRTVQMLFIFGLALIAILAIQLGGYRAWVAFDPGRGLAAAAAFFIMRLLALRLPQGDDVPVTLMVGIVSLGVLDGPSLLLASLVAGLLDVAVERTRSSSRQWLDALLDALRGTAVIAILLPFSRFVEVESIASGAGDVMLVPILIIGVLFTALDILSAAVLQSLSSARHLWESVRMLIRPLIFVYMVHIAMAAVVLRVFPQLGVWGFGIALLLTLILQNSFNLYLSIRRAYSETIGALARAAELDRPSETGHSQRVAELAIAVGRHMRMSVDELERLSFAAQLHDIGRIGSDDCDDEAEHALRGADIVATIPFLASTGPSIARHHHLEDPDLPQCAAIVGVCSEYDKARRGGATDVSLGQLFGHLTGNPRNVVLALEAVLLDRRTARSLGL